MNDLKNCHIYMKIDILMKVGNSAEIKKTGA